MFSNVCLISESGRSYVLEQGFGPLIEDVIVYLRHGTNFLKQFLHFDAILLRDRLVKCKESLFFLANHFVLLLYP